jgi:hypothetical protein
MSMSTRLTRHSRVLIISRRLFSSGDPFVLPLSPAATQRGAPTETPLPPRIQRDHETVPALRARLIYQSRKRGMLEGDLILSTFAAEHLPSMSEQELLEYDRVSLSHHSLLICSHIAFSCWMNLTGTFTTGLSKRRIHRRDGRIQSY